MRRKPPRDWPNLQRMFFAICALLLMPVFGIVVGAVAWDNLELGLLVFNELGLCLFTLLTYRYWYQNRLRKISLLVSGASVAVSTLINVGIDRIPAAYALYFAVSCECFSLIPWLIEVLQEIKQGLWLNWKPTPISRPKPQSKRQTEAQTGPDLPLPKFPWKWAAVCGGVIAVGTVILLWDSGAIEEMQFPGELLVEKELESRYHEAFQVQEIIWEEEGLRTFRVCPASDPALQFTVATGPAAEPEDTLVSWNFIGEDNYLQNAWNARIVPVMEEYGMFELPITIGPEHERKGTAGGFRLPEEFHLPEVYDGSALVGWYVLAAAYWANGRDCAESAQTIHELLERLSYIKPFDGMTPWRDTPDDDLTSYSWRDWMLPVAIHEGFVGFPVGTGCTVREIQAILEQARPTAYYYVEDGLICRQENFAPADPVPVPEYGK